MVSKFYGCSNIAEVFCCMGLIYTIANSLFPERNYFYHYIISVILSVVMLWLMIAGSNDTPIVFAFVVFFASALLVHVIWLYGGAFYMSYNVSIQNDDKSHRNVMLLAYGTFGLLYCVGKSDFHCSVLFFISHCPFLFLLLLSSTLTFYFLLCLFHSSQPAMMCHVPEIISHHHKGFIVSGRVAANIMKIIAVSCLNLVVGRTERFQILAMQQSLQARTSFIRYISHEVRTPLNVICVGLTVLEGLLEELVKKGGQCSRDIMDILSSMKVLITLIPL